MGVLPFSHRLDVFSLLLMCRIVCLQVVSAAVLAKIISSAWSFTLSLEMVCQPFDFDDICTVSAVDEHWTLSREMHFVFRCVSVVSIGSTAVKTSVVLGSMLVASLP